MTFIFRNGQYFGTSQNGIEDKKNGTEGVTFCYKIKKIQEKKLFKLVIVQEFDWLSRHV